MSTQIVDLTKLNGAQLLVEIRAGRLSFDKLATPENYPMLKLVFAEQEAEKAAAEKHAQEQATYSAKVGGKGGISVYGFGRYPVTLYFEQWKTVKRIINAVIAFGEANKSLIDERTANPLDKDDENPSKAFKLKMD